MLTTIGYYRFRLANTEFHWQMDEEPSSASVFRTRTPPGAMRTLADPRMVRRLRFRSIVCFSDEDGGDVALVALAGAPARLVAVLVDRDPSALVEFARARGIDDRVRAVVGPPPADPDIDRLLDDELGSVGPDVVVDMVSATLDAGRAAFERIFPRVRPGGCYVVERWANEHYALHDFSAAVDDPDERDELRRVTIAQVAASGDLLEQLLPAVLRVGRERPDVVSGVDVSRHWLVVERGPAEITAPFSLDDSGAR